MKPFNMITVLGATASGKTGTAALLSKRIHGEIISADSRQVYRGMTIGTGKDIDDYIVDGELVPYYLIDIVEAGYQYNVFEYQRDFVSVFQDIISRSKIPVLCGGSGMYIESILKGYKLINVPVDDDLRHKLKNKNLQHLTSILKEYKTLHNKTDVDTVKRAVRAIEIEEYYKNNPEIDTFFPEINSLIIGIQNDRDTRRNRITQRLKSRIDEGMIDEVEKLLNSGLHPDDLIYYGLEYKYITLYLQEKLTFDEMFKQLETAIHQFSKRQMTWFRKMEKQGFNIHWIDGNTPENEKVEHIISLYNNK